MKSLRNLLLALALVGFAAVSASAQTTGTDGTTTPPAVRPANMGPVLKAILDANRATMQELAGQRRELLQQLKDATPEQREAIKEQLKALMQEHRSAQRDLAKAIRDAIKARRDQSRTPPSGG